MAKKTQIDKFRDKARELETDEDAAKFDETLRRIAAGKADPKDLERTGQNDPKKNLGKKR